MKNFIVLLVVAVVIGVNYSFAAPDKSSYPVLHNDTQIDEQKFRKTLEELRKDNFLHYAFNKCLIN